MLAKLFQEFHPIGAAPKHAVVDTRSSHKKRIETTYRPDGLELFGILKPLLPFIVCLVASRPADFISSPESRISRRRSCTSWAVDDLWSRSMAFLSLKSMSALSPNHSSTDDLKASCRIVGMSDR